MKGAGSQSCGVWTKTPRESANYHMQLQWVLGYLSRANDGVKQHDFFELTDANAIEVWVDNYCGSHPLDRIYKATDILVEELRSR